MGEDVAELMVRPGMTVSAGMSLARVNGLGTVWVEAAVPQAQGPLLRVGQPAELLLPGEATPRRAKISAILPQASAEARTLRVRLELPNPGLRLREGMSLAVRLQSATEQLLLVPSALPYFVAGLKVSGGLSLIGAVTAEMVAGAAGGRGKTAAPPKVTPFDPATRSDGS